MQITNLYRPGQARERLEARRSWVYLPREGWTFSHGPFVALYGGRVYVMWQNGRKHEDDLGQRVLLAVSEDGGDTWPDPRPLMDSARGTHGEVVRTAAAFHVHNGGLNAYCTEYAYMPYKVVDGARTKGNSGHIDFKSWYLTTADGDTWSEPAPLGLPGAGPVARLSTGRLLMGGSYIFPYTDSPDGLRGWRVAGMYPPEVEPQLLPDDSEGIERILRHTGWPVMLCEGSCYETADYIVHMLLRSGTQYLWAAHSRDYGDSWSQPEPTRFTDNRTKCFFFRLPDGRYGYVGSPDPHPPGARNPLVFSISEDGYRFDRHFIIADEPFQRQYDGLDKNGCYGYPHAVCEGGTLYVAASVCKERIALFRADIRHI